MKVLRLAFGLIALSCFAASTGKAEIYSTLGEPVEWASLSDPVRNPNVIANVLIGTANERFTQNPLAISAFDFTGVTERELLHYGDTALGFALVRSLPSVVAPVKEQRLASRLFQYLLRTAPRPLAIQVLKQLRLFEEGNEEDARSRTEALRFFLAQTFKRYGKNVRGGPGLSEAGNQAVKALEESRLLLLSDHAHRIRPVPTAAGQVFGGISLIDYVLVTAIADPDHGVNVMELGDVADQLPEPLARSYAQARAAHRSFLTENELYPMQTDQALQAAISALSNRTLSTLVETIAELSPKTSSIFEFPIFRGSEYEELTAGTEYQERQFAVLTLALLYDRRARESGEFVHGWTAKDVKLKIGANSRVSRHAADMLVEHVNFLSTLLSMAENAGLLANPEMSGIEKMEIPGRVQPTRDLLTYLRVISTPFAIDRLFEHLKYLQVALLSVAQSMKASGGKK